MSETTETQVIRDLIDRLARLNAAEDWNGPLNPSQFAALSYLARANRFSRAPSHVADYLITTRGTASQTLKALARKDLIIETRSETDKRSIRYDVTRNGTDVLQDTSGLTDVINDLDADVSEALASSLKALVLAMLQRRDGRPFGICRTCKHYRNTDADGFCQLLQVSLTKSESAQICHEHAEL
ncbi:MAG: MarR family transcriptional regulator [Roseibium sp.]|uniref:MarR family winged helix-turn-helix transcriptional regulator n=1 Tax=Roseibium sp. TaxID=1936156 RepID=UPI00260C497D|nr:MarR family transcriptional regulator [Roseibium sp.]MCV0427811.1 MarR family transcriptional regulator [Roseibium sp.]